MLAIFESILPIFLLVLLGVALRRSPLIDGTFWNGLEQCGYYVLFPALLFHTLARADFTSIDLHVVGMTAIGVVLLMCLFVLLLWPALRRIGVRAPAFSSLFQAATRWNSFIALAIADKLYGATGLTVVAVVMAAIIIPLNFINVSVLLWFSGAHRGYWQFTLRVISNPQIVSSALGVAVNLLGIPIYEPLMVAVGLVAQASLSLGLIAVGAGLKVRDAVRPRPMVLVGTAIKLIVFPVVMIGIATLVGIGGQPLVLLALSAAVPTAMNGYILAKKMGGDAELYAATATVQTAASFLTIPAVLLFAGQLAAG
ncbi:AEC family transporter [Neorhizobium sp. CSC1952]|uniref:AEC family transporter n=1 Tax=Neorhizobium sp. CSC1952 TaxID=2978974 RepID=UPI0025A62C00|nr:AEC family transporter [Rhizobium sp. CSC1952]WJR67283.1 AEC family transporter [Rhizobium sp. CSC1952]